MKSSNALLNNNRFIYEGVLRERSADERSYKCRVRPNAIWATGLLAFAVLPCHAVRTDRDANVSIIDDLAQGWIWSGMTQTDSQDCHGQTMHVGGPGTYGAYTFQGTGIRVFAPAANAVACNGRLHKVGHYKVSIDGKAIQSSETVDGMEGDACIFAVSSLSDGNHVLQVEPELGWISVDFVQVLSKADTTADKTGKAAASKRGPIKNGIYQVMLAEAPQQGLDISGRSSANGAEVQVYLPAADPQPNQQFQVTDIGGGKYTISPMNAPGKVLTVLDSAAPGMPLRVGLWSYTADPHQVWNISQVAPGDYRISPDSAPDFAMLPLNGFSTNATRIVLQPWSGQPAQAWRFIWISE